MTPLFYLATPKTGGWPTYTAHLAHGLGDAQIFKIGKRDEGRMRPFGRNMLYQNVSLATAIDIAEQYASIIVATDKKYFEAATELAKRCITVIHDPTELKGGIGPHLQQTVVIRESMLQHLPEATFIKHPYQRCPIEPSFRTHAPTGSVAISRVDFDKRTHLIAEANELGAGITIYGTENRMYTYHKLDNDQPNWRKHYRGPFPANDLWAGARLCALYANMVDMSVIVGDGGGTQYTFLEALDAGTGIILHNEWNPQGLLGEIAQTVSNAQELHDATQNTNLDQNKAEELLKQHDANTIAHHYRQLLTTSGH